MFVYNCKIINLPKIEDSSGNLSVIEEINNIPFKIQRVCWIYDVPGGQTRGGYAFKKSYEFIVALSGSFNVVIEDGKNKKVFNMNRSYFGLYIPNLLWRSMENFSTNALCMILASEHYSEDDYIRDNKEFLKL